MAVKSICCGLFFTWPYNDDDVDDDDVDDDDDDDDDEDDDDDDDDDALCQVLLDYLCLYVLSVERYCKTKLNSS